MGTISCITGVMVSKETNKHFQYDESDIDIFFFKKVSHLTHKYSDGSGFSFGFDDRGPDTHLKWDKCVPSEIEFDDNVDEFK